MGRLRVKGVVSVRGGVMLVKGSVGKRDQRGVKGISDAISSG